jgi:hypothetical protein
MSEDDCRILVRTLLERFNELAFESDNVTAQAYIVVLKDIMMMIGKTLDEKSKRT